MCHVSDSISGHTTRYLSMLCCALLWCGLLMGTRDVRTPQDLHIETSVYTESGRNVPNVLNAYRDIFEYAFLKVRKFHSCCPCCALAMRTPLPVLFHSQTSLCSGCTYMVTDNCLSSTNQAGIYRPAKTKMVILNHLSSVLKPGRTTLLLGPPAAGGSLHTHMVLCSLGT